MPIPNGLKNSLNRIREISTEIYHQYIPIITDDTDISSFATPILTVPQVQNEFISQLVNRIIYSQFITKNFRNPLKDLEGTNMPLGYIGQEIYANPARGRVFNINDFAGLLQKYESDVKVQYMTLNKDIQYPVTVSRAKLKTAFTSWESLNEFIDGITQTLYNGAYIDEYRFTKYLVSSAYNGNNVQIQTVTAPTTEELAKQFMTQARALFLNFQSPSTQYNAWAKVGGYGHPIVTWSNPEDIVFILRNDIRAFIDVNVLANAFNIDKAELMGRIYTVDDFNVYTDEGELLFNGSNILGIMCDKNWFRIKTQEEYMDEFYNANNRTWQMYLNVVRMYQYSLFANAVIWATAMPTVAVTGLDYNNTTEVTLTAGDSEGLDIVVTPNNATTPISYELDDSTHVTLTTDSNNDRHITLTGVSEGSATLTAKAGNISTTLKVTVTAS